MDGVRFVCTDTGLLILEVSIFILGAVIGTVIGKWGL